MKINLVLFALLLSFHAFSKAYVDKTETLKEGGSEYAFRMNFFSPTSYSDVNGENESLDEGESFLESNLFVSGSYGYSKNLQFTLGLNFRYAQSTGTYDSEERTLTASGLESTYAQIKYAFDPIDRLQYSLEFNFRQATYANKLYEANQQPEVPDFIEIGDGIREVSAGLGFSYRTRSENFVTGRFVFVQRGDDLSNEILSEVEYSMAWQYFAMLIGVENIYSANQDSFADNPEDKPRLSRGSSRDLNAINRTWTAPYVGINIGLGQKWRVEFKAKSRISATSSYLGNDLGINFIRRNSVSDTFGPKDSAFKEYRYEGTVTKVSKSKRAVTIDMGLEVGVEKGSKVDFYFFDYLEGSILVASGYVVKVGSTKSIVKITKKYTKEKIKEGLSAKAGLIKN